MIYHITTQNDWSKALKTGEYQADSLKNEGFIHCSTIDQVLTIANAFYKDVEGVIIIEIDENEINSEIKYENLEGGSELFPHIYGIIPVKSVTRIIGGKIDHEGNYFL